MLNVHDLERRWLKHKIKTYVPLAIGGVTGLVVIVILALYLPTSKEEVKELVVEKQRVPTTIKDLPPTVNKEVVQVDINVPKNTIYSQNIIPVEEDSFIQSRTSQSSINEPSSDKNILVLRPSLHFMDSIEDGISPYLEDEYIQNTPVTQETINTNTVQYQSSPEVETKVKPKKSNLSITRKQNTDDLKDVIRRFKKNKNPALSLFIAKRYYSEGEYQKSYNYALMTNEIDKSIDESWIIFSKSLVKLGQHELAMNTLKSYLKTTKSSTAEVLLRKIEAGSFK